MVPFESDNLKAYQLLLRIEVAIRELLKTSLESQDGAQWRRRLPAELLRKIKASQTEECRPQFGYKRLGPLYYLSFGELLTLLRAGSGRQVAARLGGDGVMKQIETILVPRNAVCHSRPVSSVGLKTIDTLYSEIEAAITAHGLARLFEKPDVGLAQDQVATEMIPALHEVLCTLPQLPPSFAIPAVFQTATLQYWWADDSLAGFNCSAVEACIAAMREYNALPAGVGCAGARQRFIEQSDMESRVRHAVSELEHAKL